MQSNQPDPTDPWPHDMAIALDTPRSLMRLLFVRHAWHLEIDDVPALDGDPHMGLSARPPAVGHDEASERWREEWRRAWSAYDSRDRGIRAPDPETARLLRELDDEQLVTAFSTQPSDFWDHGIDDEAFTSWVMQRHDDTQLPFDEQPERRSLEALIPAWRSGLRTIIELPYRGAYSHRIAPHLLVVSRTTRHDPLLFTEALRRR